MATRPEIVVTLDGRVLDAARPIVFADDPTFSRGDGVFETVLIRAGSACLLDAHVARLIRSAAITGLPRPDQASWLRAAAVAVAQWPGGADAVLRMVLGRGRGGAPTAFVTVSALPPRVVAARRDGVSAVTLDRGVSAGDDSAAPWSIMAAKSLSYASNTAALRHAEGVGAGDVVFVSSDGFVLEGPRSNVVIQAPDGQLVTPPETAPILAGTTAQALFEAAVRRGLTCARRPIMASELLVAQGVWLLSSITLAARVHTLDGALLPPLGERVPMAELVDEAIAGTV